MEDGFQYPDWLYVNRFIESVHAMRGPILENFLTIEDMSKADYACRQRVDRMCDIVLWKGGNRGGRAQEEVE